MRNRDRLLRRAADGVRDPWVLLVAALGGGAAWGVGIPVEWSAGVTAAMVATGALVTVFTARPPERDDVRPDPRLRPGTMQADLTRTLEGYIADLRKLRRSRLPEALTDPAIEALVAAGGARDVAVRVAAAVDGLDLALERASGVHSRWVGRGGGTGSQVGAAVDRMRERRAVLLNKLDNAVGEVAEVYTKLLELSATADMMALSDGGLGEVEDVSRSLDSLRGALAELEADASAVRGLTDE